MYKGPKGVEILQEFEIAPILESTPATPHVRDQFSCCNKTNDGTDLSVFGAVQLSPPWPAEYGKYNSNGDEAV